MFAYLHVEINSKTVASLNVLLKETLLCFQSRVFQVVRMCLLLSSLCGCFVKLFCEWAALTCQKGYVGDAQMKWILCSWTLLLVEQKHNFRNDFDAAVCYRASGIRYSNKMPGDTVFSPLHWSGVFNLRSKCTVPLSSDHFQPVYCLCWCNRCVLMRVIIDCCSQQKKINSLCIMTSPTHSICVFLSPLLPLGL